MAKRGPSWKENKIISIETRKGLFVLARMLQPPFLAFYNLFSENQNWDKVDLSQTPILLWTAVARQFLNSSNIVVQKQLIDTDCSKINKYFIHSPSVYRTLKVWENTENEMECLVMGHGGSLIKKNPCEAWVESNSAEMVIDFNDNEIIDKYDLDHILFYPSLNERLYLCYKFGKNVDPFKDLVFDRKIPLEYMTFIKLCNNQISEEEWEKLPL